MGNEVKGIYFGGATVFEAEKVAVDKDEKGQQKYCVWLKCGTYVEYPEQKKEPVISYFARSTSSGVTYPIAEKTYKSNKTEKDGYQYVFEKEIGEAPYLSSDFIGEAEGKKYYQQIIDGFKGIKVWGSQNPDNIRFSNTKNAVVVTNNDKEKDDVSIMINCKDINCNGLESGKDVLNRWAGYEKGKGYSTKFEHK